MLNETVFRAPWGWTLKLVTGLVVLILLGIPAFSLLLQPAPEPSLLWYLSMIALPLSILLISSLFTIRHYRLSAGKLYVRRLLWDTAIDLKTLRKVEVDPEAMSRSIRTFGNGGFFSFSGAYRSKKLGPYRALATDPARAVVLYMDKRTIVVTPEDPQRFAGRLESALSPL